MIIFTGSINLRLLNQKQMRLNLVEVIRQFSQMSMNSLNVEHHPRDHFFLWSLPLPLSIEYFVIRHEYSHPCQQPLGVRLFLLAVGYRPLTTIKLSLVLHLLISWNCAHEEPLQLLKQELFTWPAVAFWTVYSVSLLGTIEEA